MIENVKDDRDDDLETCYPLPQTASKKVLKQMSKDYFWDGVRSFGPREKKKCMRFSSLARAHDRRANEKG